ncbi:hypothetical protein SeMB42_g03603 [Synchytrium endobioticum]|uniref:Cytochrome c oxidase assembly protein CtaG/Cox11 n=1 Tax=Synchytrium endobioticum TaxID=286115 RepID=A0A507DDU2_9FUNG|nr:hypothetical protein SeMB42_g03603 [Synchytrium endobioticum]TPX49571.1 hypothetical protein SeLEV6574_g01395 [Synchytrium endobioticum]
MNRASGTLCARQMMKQVSSRVLTNSNTMAPKSVHAHCRRHAIPTSSIIASTYRLFSQHQPRRLALSYHSTAISSSGHNAAYVNIHHISRQMNTSTTPNTNNPTTSFRDMNRQANSHGIETVMYYSAAVIVTFVGLSYAAVPLYKLICTQTGLDGTPLTSAGHKFDPEDMVPLTDARPIKVYFDSSTSDAMKWNFKPVVKAVSVVPGETALTFFTAKNPTNEDIVGISTYSVVPPKAAQYFNKIQCFCFEEQKLAAGEEVDMPVFFYIDPEFTRDPWMKDVSSITLHYTFFKSKIQT